VGGGDLATKTTPQTLHFGVEKSRFNRKKNFNYYFFKYKYLKEKRKLHYVVELVKAQIGGVGGLAICP